ncbi:MAG: hypothetical protein QXI58_08095 [Candidatus Micrarchaeia archaeon]
MPSDKKIITLMPNKNQTFEKRYLLHLFENFIMDLPHFYIYKIIPFPAVYFWFSHRRIDKKTAKEILRAWCNLGLCEWKAYHGIKVKEEKEKFIVLQNGGGNGKQFKCK